MTFEEWINSPYNIDEFIIVEKKEWDATLKMICNSSKDKKTINKYGDDKITQGVKLVLVDMNAHSGGSAS